MRPALRVVGYGALLLLMGCFLLAIGLAFADVPIGGWLGGVIGVGGVLGALVWIGVAAS